MKAVQQDIDERTNLTSTNKFELLLFRLGTDSALGKSELFGINVFKIREIVAMPSITPIAGTTQVLAFEAVEDIVGRDWKQVPSPETSGAAGKLVTSIARLDGNTDES